MLNLFQHLIKMTESYTYIMTNTYRTTFYVGVTSDISKRTLEHANDIGSEFTKKYNLKYLVYLEVFTDISQAISREKQLKNWKKEWKLNLIRKVNPKLKTLEL